MKALSKILCGCSMLVLVPAAVNAAGTYYTGNTYQSPQVARYNSSAYSNSRSTMGTGAYNQARYSSYTNRYGQNAQNGRVAMQNRAQSQMQNAKGQKEQVKSGGFKLDAGLSYKTGMWQFDMNTAGSRLHYDNLGWAVFDVNAGYDFNVGKSVLALKAGVEYGMQIGESTMVDDDISNGGYEVQRWYNDAGGLEQIQMGHALSVGATKGGDMLGLNASVGLKDVFTWGKVKITPSIGWRHFKYTLETKGNYGLKIDTLNNNNSCTDYDGMTQCWPAIGFYQVLSNNDVQYQFKDFVYVDIDGDDLADLAGIPLDGLSGYVDTMESFYFHQSNMSHSYEVTWSGPFLALDMLYDINENNAVTARLEIGLPGYNATADQPYRTEWQHPKSIEDEAGIGSAFHIGLGANWTTALTDRVSLSLGVTYDYYNVSGADANTYLDPTYWQAVYDGILDAYENDPELTFADRAEAEQAMLNGFIYGGYEYGPDATAVYINNVRSNGWKDTVSDEIDSFFKSLGVRVGLTARF